MEVACQEAIKHQAIASNVSRLIAEQKTTVVEVAKALALPVMTVRRIALGETRDPRISTLKLLAQHFDVSLDALLDEKSGASTEQPSLPTTWVPILPWEQLSDIESSQSLDLSIAKVWQPVMMYQQQALGGSSFALMSKPFMHNRFPAGTVFIVDPDVAPKDGDIVLLSIVGEPTLKHLHVDPPQWCLSSLTNTEQEIPFNKQQHQILGVVMLSLLFNQRMARSL